jgi:hypothetical protein
MASVLEFVVAPAVDTVVLLTYLATVVVSSEVQFNKVASSLSTPCAALLPFLCRFPPPPLQI